MVNQSSREWEKEKTRERRRERRRKDQFQLRIFVPSLLLYHFLSLSFVVSIPFSLSPALFVATTSADALFLPLSLSLDFLSPIPFLPFLSLSFNRERMLSLEQSQLGRNFSSLSCEIQFCLSLSLSISSFFLSLFLFLFLSLFLLFRIPIISLHLSKREREGGSQEEKGRKKW